MVEIAGTEEGEGWEIRLDGGVESVQKSRGGAVAEARAPFAEVEVSGEDVVRPGPVEIEVRRRDGPQHGGHSLPGRGGCQFGDWEGNSGLMIFDIGVLRRRAALVRKWRGVKGVWLRSCQDGDGKPLAWAAAELGKIGKGTAAVLPTRGSRAVEPRRIIMNKNVTF